MSERPKRKPIPTLVKLLAVLRVDGRCKQCGERLGDLSGLNFDHRPAVINRDVSADGTDYVPAQLDPDFIEPLHINCHKVRTFGPGGEKRITTAGSDIGTRDKVDRLAEQHAETVRNILSPTKRKTKPQSRWPKRPIRSRPSQQQDSRR